MTKKILYINQLKCIHIYRYIHRFTPIPKTIIHMEWTFYFSLCLPYAFDHSGIFLSFIALYHLVVAKTIKKLRFSIGFLYLSIVQKKKSNRHYFLKMYTKVYVQSHCFFFFCCIPLLSGIFFFGIDVKIHRKKII